MRLAVYPGSFDPITYGHVDLIRRSLLIADRIIVAVLGNAAKAPTFTTEERVAQVRRAIRGMKRVEVQAFDGLLVDYLRKTRASVVIRGLRAVSDIEYEFQMAHMNRQLSRNWAETVFLMPAAPFTYLSSSIVKEIARFGGDVRRLVPPHVAAALRARVAHRR
jgi:pantetheine-phosphate adenylyltransferase